jgi:hypothetical protein
MRLTRWSRFPGPPLLMLLGACAGWQQVGVSPSVLAENPAEVRLTSTDGTRVVLEAPRLSADSLHGKVNGRDTVIALAAVTRMAVPKQSSAKGNAAVTFFAALAAAVAVGWAIVLVE